MLPSRVAIATDIRNPVRGQPAPAPLTAPVVATPAETRRPPARWLGRRRREDRAGSGGSADNAAKAEQASSRAQWLSDDAPGTQIRLAGTSIQRPHPVMIAENYGVLRSDVADRRDCCRRRPESQSPDRRNGPKASVRWTSRSVCRAGGRVIVAWSPAAPSREPGMVFDRRMVRGSCQHTSNPDALRARAVKVDAPGARSITHPARDHRWTALPTNSKDPQPGESGQEVQPHSEE